MLFPPLSASRTRLANRYNCAECQVEYLRVATDLQVSKASGILSFSAILCALAIFLLQKPPDGAALADLLFASSAFFAASGSTLMLRTLWSSAPEEDEFKTAGNEAEWLLRLHHLRAVLSNCAVVLVGLAGIALFLGALLRWQCNRV